MSKKNRQRKTPRTNVDIQWNNFNTERLGMGSRFKNNPQLNTQRRTEQMYVRVLSEMCMNRFQWKNLPRSANERYLEKVLYSNALVVFFYHEPTGTHLCLRATQGGQQNMYDEPTTFIVNGNQIIHETMSAKKVVPIWGNYMRMPDVDIVMLYAARLAELDRTIQINTTNMRNTKLIVAEEDQLLTYENINRQAEEGVKTIKVNSSVDLEKIQVLDLGVDPRSLPALQTAKKDLWNECLTLLGVNNNAGEDKKERLVANEVDANEDEVMVYRATSLKARKIACKEINEKFTYADGTKLNVDVEYVNDFKPPAMPGLSSLLGR